MTLGEVWETHWCTCFEKGLSDWLGCQSLYIVPWMTTKWHIKSTNIWNLCVRQLPSPLWDEQTLWKLIQNPWFALTFMLANGKMILSKLVGFWSSISIWQQPQLLSTMEYLKVFDFSSTLELQLQTLLFNLLLLCLFCFVLFFGHKLKNQLQERSPNTITSGQPTQPEGNRAPH